ncbi:hypothetical protein DPV78_003497 [Talaromyces pinophilus]|nr:hypothetical protein DPV78_003497 [Talaromyces pinophilus]
MAPASGKRLIWLERIGPRFLRRSPEQCRTSVQTATDFHKSNAQDPGVIRSWFDRLQTQLDTYNIKPENFNTSGEMGSRVCKRDTEAEITTYRVFKHVDGTALHESMTIVECLSVLGNVISPFIILTNNTHLDYWKHDIQPDWKLAFSLNGFASDDLAIERLHHFDMSTCDLLAILPREKKHNPVLFPASFHTSVDGKLFRDYRKFHGEAVSRQTAQGDHYFDKSDFLYSINELRQQMFVRRKIKTELEERGIWPLNDEIVVKWLQSKPESTDELMDETLTGDEPNLPSTSSAKTTRAKYFL